MNDERELTRYQCGLVDTCFEEGQYESGMTVLDQLRSSSFKPHADHIRQLLYIALFPPPLIGDQPFQRDRSSPSPVKASPTKQRPSLSKASLSPSLTDSETAQRLLFSFLGTNSPGSLSRALPRYDAAPNDQRSSINQEDSLVAQESICIRNSRNCWSILKEGFIQRKKLPPRDTGRKRTRSSTYDVDDPDLYQGHDGPAIIAEHAWPVLDWLLFLFEKDEVLGSQSPGENFSFLLLSQIPPPRGNSGSRWEAGAPLDIIFHAVVQENVQRRAMAARLLSLLINLTLSGSFDGPTFAAALTTRLYTSSSQIVQNLMESLPKTAHILAFKITVCQKFLSSGPSITGGAKPRPRPLPRRGPRRGPEAASSLAADNDDGRSASSAVPPPVLASCSDIFQLLYDQKSSKSPVLTIKYVLLVSYAHLQRLLPPEERDSDWENALSNSKLRHVVDTTFPSDSTYHAALTIVIGFWAPLG